jgi:hypothetical protein
MLNTRGLGLVAAGAVVLAALAAPAPSQAKEPPQCAKIEFRPVPSGMTDGEQDAGLYKSRFGKLEVRATVKEGEPRDYYVVVNGKQLAPLTGAVPKSAESCAQEKRLAAPGKPVDACTGQKFATVIDRAGDKRTVLLYALQGREWKFCRAGTV